jgi:hypothetical protein
VVTGEQRAEEVGNAANCIERVNYIAHNAKDPEAAARFAAERLGFTVEHAAPDGTHYLSAHGIVEKLGAPLDLIHVVRDHQRRLSAYGHGDDDPAKLFDVLLRERTETE